jgi:MscS family membrane protein
MAMNGRQPCRAARLFPVILVVALALLPASVAGLSDLRRAHAQEAPRPVPGAAGAPDSLGRATPRGAMGGFLAASGSGDYGRAAEYLDLRRLPEPMRAGQGPGLARELRVVLDQTVAVDLDALGDEPEGSRRDPRFPDREIAGTIPSKKGAVPVLLQRVPGDAGAPIWKISASTVAQIPGLYREFGYGPLGGILPPPFFELRLLDVALWQWIGLLLLVAIAFGLSRLTAVRAVRTAAALARRTTTLVDDALLASLVGPLRLAIGVLLFVVGSALLDLSIPARQFFGGLEKILTIAVAAWVALRAVDVFGDVAVQHLGRRGRTAAIAVVPLGRKATKVAVVALAVLAALQNVGFNVTGILAGLGIGGLAVALAAQKTLENLFGGISLIVDQPVRVGDFCRFGDKLGTVEEVGLRSTRVRTLDRTIVSVPNGQFAALTLENYTQRDRIWLHATLGLRYETSPDQLRYVLVEIRRMLYGHPKIDPDPGRIRFIGFGAYSLDLEIFAYVRTTDFGEFLAVQEDVNLRIIDIVAASGTGFAFPSQTTYIARDGGLDRDRARQAESRVAEWRDARALYLPDFPREVVAALDGTLEYPPRGAAGAPDR